MEKMAHFFECLLPVSICNLECEYCYLIQQNRRAMRNELFDYDVEHMIKALSMNRLGGCCYFSLCGAGESFLQKGIIELVKGLLQEGHYVNVTTNGTITKKIDEIISLEPCIREKLQIAFSFHYLELKKQEKIEEFFENVKKTRKAGVSILVQLNLYDGYLEHLEEIKKICIEKIGAMPQVALTRKEDKKNFFIMTEKSKEVYYDIGKTFNSPLFEMTVKNFNVKRREFCYAGDWTATIDMKRGIMSPCYKCGRTQNIFENIETDIKFEAIGHNCRNAYCINSSHFMALGVIPEKKVPTYVGLRNREEADWYNDRMKSFLSQKFIDSKEEYSMCKKCYIDIKQKSFRIYQIGKSIVNRFTEKLGR